MEPNRAAQPAATASKPKVKSKGEHVTTLNSVDVLILTALPKELDAVRANSGPWSRERNSETGFEYYLTTAYHGLSIAASGMTGMGPVSAAITTSTALTALRPKRVLLVGICAGIADDVQLGDICVSDQVVDYDLGKVRDGKYTPRWRAYASDADLVRAARSFTDPAWANTILTQRPSSDGADPTVHVGTVLSGSKIVADIAIVDSLKNVWSQAVGLEMEGAGTAAAAHEHDTRPSFILIKGVCDRATAEKDDRWQEYAADAAGRYAISLLIDRGGDVELKAAAVAPPVQRADELAQLGLTKRELLAMLVTGLNLLALQQLCFELDVEWEDLPNRSTKSGAAMDIISGFTRRKELSRLLGYLKENHPTLF